MTPTMCTTKAGKKGRLLQAAMLRGGRVSMQGDRGRRSKN